MLAGCSRQPAPATLRIAILRFENLTPDPSLDWMGRGASEIIAREMGAGKAKILGASALRGNPLTQFRPLSAPGQSAERGAALAEGATRMLMGQVSRVGNRLLLEVTERDPATGKTVDNFTLSSSNPNDLYSLADNAARRLSPQIAPFESKNNQAIAEWIRGMEETDYGKMTGNYARAVQADPAFASAWLSWATAASARGDRAAAAQILAQAQQHANAFPELARVRLKLVAAQFAGDRAATLAAMNEIGRLLPEDADNLRAIADQNFAAHQYPTAAAAYRRLTQINPKDTEVWNQLGYVLMYSGDYNGAISALQTYQGLRPNDPNPLDSQGDVAFAFGRFSEAEALYKKASAQNPAFQDALDLYKAAFARLMTGDIAGAQKNFDVYASARRTVNDPVLPLRAAQWRFLSGKHDEALALLTGVQSPPQIKAVAMSQMAIWDLQIGRRPSALVEANDALKTGAAPPSAFIARFAAEDAHSAADWSARADKLFATPQAAELKPLALAYALYLAHDWQAAEPVWKQLLDRLPPGDAVGAVGYARILLGLNRPRDAEPYVKLFPIPALQGGQEFLSLAFPQIFEVRAAVLKDQGKASEAEASMKLFRTLWGEPL